VDMGIFKYIRHPLYSSLLFLTWGIFLKHTTLFMLVFALLSTAFLFATALIEEKENVAFFGEKYKEYMKRTKMFVPYIL
jgi:protein-S-isoprenylcysteine O-methyltransferase Ste14